MRFVVWRKKKTKKGVAVRVGHFLFHKNRRLKQYAVRVLCVFGEPDAGYNLTAPLVVAKYI